MRLAVLKAVKAVKGCEGSIPFSLRHIAHKYGGTKVGVNTNAAKAAQLGMPFGTAAHRLRKMIMFRMMQKCAEDTCHNCGDKIETVDELSIEHIEPWLGVNPDLFWDLDNITWSHLRCNRPNRPNYGNFVTGHTPANKMQSADGLWCGLCRTYKHPDEFSNKKTRWSGKEDRCRSCRATIRGGGRAA